MMKRNFGFLLALVALGSFAIGCDDSDDETSLGMTCTVDKDCNSTLKYCDAGRCMSKKPGGSTCKKKSECLSGEATSNNICTCKKDDECANGYICADIDGSKECQKPTQLSVGESCFVDDNCASNYCYNGACGCRNNNDCPQDYYCSDHACTNKNVVPCPDKYSDKKCVLIADVRPNIMWGSDYNPAKDTQLKLTKDKIQEGEILTNDMTLYLPEQSQGVNFCGTALASTWTTSEGARESLNLNTSTYAGTTVADAFTLLDHNPYICNIIRSYDTLSADDLSFMSENFPNADKMSGFVTNIHLLTDVDANNNCKSTDLFIKDCLANDKNKTIEQLINEVNSVSISEDCSDKAQIYFGEIVSKYIAPTLPMPDDQKGAVLAGIEAGFKSTLPTMFSASLHKVYSLYFDIRIRSRKMTDGNNAGCIEFPLDSPFTFKYQYNDNSVFKGHDFIAKLSLNNSELLPNLDQTTDENKNADPIKSQFYLSNGQVYSSNINYVTDETPFSGNDYAVYYEVNKCNNADCNKNLYEIAWKSTIPKDNKVGAEVACSELEMYRDPIHCAGKVAISGNVHDALSADKAYCSTEQGAECTNGIPDQEIVVTGCSTKRSSTWKDMYNGDEPIINPVTGKPMQEAKEITPATPALNACIKTPITLGRYQVYVVL